MKKYGPALLRYCHSILCNYHDAQDALQATFIKAYYKKASFKEGSALSPWLYRIAYTTSMDILRKRKFATFFPSVGLQEKECQDYIPEKILSALLKLSGADRALVYGRIMEERSYDELALIHKISATALRKRYERARKKLAGALKEDYPYYTKTEET
ncbi:MAG: sigma-70 family RNA polymerase sigma factor [Clostridiales bacterium]|nr:sigma-70 family RNA polymerase sigma factor [Clostridiales bacterium]